MDEVMSNEAPSLITIKPAKKPTPKAKKPPAEAAAATAHKEGLFSPIVFGAKTILGEESLNQIRGKVIGKHSEVISNFVNTYDTPFGNAVARNIFAIMDKNRDGVVDENELAMSFKALGFTWLQEKQVSGILKRADKDDNGLIDYSEFMDELPKTLRTNLIKLAKKNGGDLGFLVL